MALQFKQAYQFLSYWSKQYFTQFGQLLKKCLAYWNLQAIFEFLR